MHSDRSPQRRVPLADLLAAAEARFLEELGRIEPAKIDEERAFHDSLSEAIHDYCKAAEDAGLPPEQVITQLKRNIARHFGSALVHPGLFAKDLVWRAVQRCIKGYYEKHTTSKAPDR